MIYLVDFTLDHPAAEERWGVLGSAYGSQPLDGLPPTAAVP